MSWKGPVCDLCAQTHLTRDAQIHPPLPPSPPRPPRRLFMSSQVKADGARPNKAQVPGTSCLHFPSLLPRAAVPHSPTLGEGEKATSAISRALPVGGRQVCSWDGSTQGLVPFPCPLRLSLGFYSRACMEPAVVSLLLVPCHGLLGSEQRAALGSQLWFAVGGG